MLCAQKFLWVHPLYRGERNAHFSSRHLLLKGPGGRGNNVAARGRKPMSGRQDNNKRCTWFQRASEDAPFHGGIEVSPPHPPLEGEGGRRGEDVGDGSSVSNLYVSEDYTQNSMIILIQFNSI